MLKKGQQPSVPDERRCVGHTAGSDGKRCPNAAIKGGSVCSAHGGKAPQVKAKAKERLLIAAVMKEFALAAKEPDRVMAEIGCIAFSRIGSLYSEDGSLMSTQAMPEHVQAFVAGVETLKRNVTTGDGKVDDVLKVRLWDKPKMLELLAKHHGLAEERIEHHGGLEITWKSSE